MKKGKINSDSICENKEVFVNELINLCLWYQIESSHTMIKLFESEIKAHKMEKEIILNSNTVKSAKEHMGESLDEIDKKIFELYKNIGEEISIMEKMESNIVRNNEDKKMSESMDDFISYYDLLSFLKYGIMFKKVSLNEFNKEIKYIYDNKGNYIIEDSKYVDEQFTRYLFEFAPDISKFKKNIKVIEK